MVAGFSLPRLLSFAAVSVAFYLTTCSEGADQDSALLQSPQVHRRLVIAFSSLRERPAFAGIHFYRHDGVDQGELSGSIPISFERADSHPSLTSDGGTCVYASKQVGGFTPLVNIWSRLTRETLPGPSFNADTGSRIEPCVSGDGKLVALCARGQAGSLGGWDVQLFDRSAGKFVELPGLNSEEDEREVTMSADGRLMAFASNRASRPGQPMAGLTDILLYDRESATLVALEGINSDHREINPSLSADGSYLAFVSDRPGGTGGKDIYLYDLALRRLAELPGLNSVAHEQTPSVSPDGRFIAFVSERTSGTGERDIFLYDRERSRLIPTPGLNSKQEDFDPCLVYEPVPRN